MSPFLALRVVLLQCMRDDHDFDRYLFRKRDPRYAFAVHISCDSCRYLYQPKSHRYDRMAAFVPIGLSNPLWYEPLKLRRSACSQDFKSERQWTSRLSFRAWRCMDGRLDARPHRTTCRSPQ